MDFKVIVSFPCLVMVRLRGLQSIKGLSIHNIIQNLVISDTPPPPPVLLML